MDAVDALHTRCTDSNPSIDARCCIIFLTVILIVSCGGKYGRLERSQEVNEIFNTYQVLADYKYYFSGPEGRPDAIVGILRSCTLETTRWTEFNASETLLKKWVDWINFHYSRSTRHYPYGSFILDSVGKQVGIWYSIWDWTTVIQKEDHRIEVYPPMRSDPLNEIGNDFERDKKF